MVSSKMGYSRVAIPAVEAGLLIDPLPTSSLNNRNKNMLYAVADLVVVTVQDTESQGT
jgi:hypothetical protein